MKISEIVEEKDSQQSVEYISYTSIYNRKRWFSFYGFNELPEEQAFCESIWVIA